MRAAVVGAVGSTEVLLEALIADPAWRVPIVVTLPEDLHHRHSDIVDLSPLATRAGARLFRARKTNDPETIAAVREANPDYIFVVGWSQLCGSEFMAIRPDRIIGYHPAALPRLRGRAALPWTILLDEKITAGSLFWLCEGTDDGDLITQEYFHVAQRETAASLYDKHMRALAAMLARALPALAAGDEPRTAQDPQYATYATRRTPADGRIDWQHPATEIDRLIRAVGKPYPGAFTSIGDARLTIWSSTPAPDDGRIHAMPGQIVHCSGDQLCIQTGAGLLLVEEWDVEGETALRPHQVLGRTS